MQLNKKKLDEIKYKQKLKSRKKEHTIGKKGKDLKKDLKKDLLKKDLKA